jgi:hypothetical protein
MVSGLAIAGTPLVGQTLTAIAAVDGKPKPSIAYQWQRDGTAIAGATAKKYTVTSADAGHTLSVVVVATSRGSSATASAVAGVVPSPPAFAAAPSITPSAGLGTGTTLTATASATGWPAPALTYEWQRCNGAGASCVAAGTGSQHTITEGELGSRFVVVVTASNLLGSVTATSAITAVAGSAAQVDGPATLSGGTTVGAVVKVSASSSGDPAPTLTYTWQRCTESPTRCTMIPTPANPTTYTLADADVGFSVRVIVTASNVLGTDTATSNAPGPITRPLRATPPSAPRLGMPTISGVALVGEPLVVVATATGNPEPALSFQWQRCDASGGTCQDIALAAGLQYTVSAADAGARIRVVVTAGNGVGSEDVARSTPTDIVRSDASALGTGFDTTVSGLAGASTGTPKRKVLTPFPRVRLRGRMLRNGAQVTLFAVTAPPRSRIDVRCKGRGCPRARYVVTATRGRTRIRRFERFLQAGIHLSVRISRRGYVGKYSSFVIRALKPPERHDMCLYSATAKPVRCRS